MKNINHPSDTLPNDESRQTGLPLCSGDVSFVKEIQLTQGKVALVDDEDYERVNQFKWYANKLNKNKVLIWYAAKGIRNNIKPYKWTTMQMHRFILGITDPNILVDHKNHNGLDNRKCNLRVCTYSQNGMNRSPQTASSIYKGVSFYDCYKERKWRAAIYLNGKMETIGFFYTEIEAAIAYNNRAIELYGEFAFLNVIIEQESKVN